jgi:tight adherence protein C
MGLAIFAFIVIFLLIASAGLLLFYRDAMFHRVSNVIAPHARQGTFLETLQQKGVSLGRVVEHLERLIPKNQKEVSVAQQRLITAGYRGDSAVKNLYGAKALVPATLVLLVAVFAPNSSFFLYIATLGIGFLLPDFWLSRRITIRQRRIRLGLPDVLDLLVICVEAGLSLDQATIRTCEELAIAHPALSDELGIVVLEQRAGRPRADAWRHFAERTGVDSVRNLVSILIQSEQFGTSIAKTLRVHSETLRTQRRQTAEEQAAKTTIKLAFPLVLFIFPSLFVVTLGPAMLIMSDSFQKFFNH